MEVMMMMMVVVASCCMAEFPCNPMMAKMILASEK